MSQGNCLPWHADDSDGVRAALGANDVSHAVAVFLANGSARSALAEAFYRTAAWADLRLSLEYPLNRQTVSPRL